MDTREEFENSINNSSLFEIDKSKNPVLYETEKYAFFTLLTKYYRIYVYPQRPLEDYSYTLIETATKCIRYYDRKKGEFLHFFNNVMKQDLGISRAKELIDEHRKGIKLATQDERLIRKIVSFAKSKNLDISDSGIHAKIAAVFGISAEDVKELLRINDNASAMRSTVKNNDGESMEVFDLQADNADLPGDVLLAKDGLKDVVARIDAVFRTVQERQKRLLSLLLTAEVVKAIDYDINEAVTVLQECSFFNREIIVWYEQHGKIPTAKQMGEMCNTSEQSLSRTYNRFKDKMKQNN